jgi:hypothetical protein
MTAGWQAGCGREEGYGLTVGQNRAAWRKIRILQAGGRYEHCKPKAGKKKPRQAPGARTKQTGGTQEHCRQAAGKNSAGRWADKNTAGRRWARKRKEQ